MPWTIVRPNWFYQNLTDGPLRDLIDPCGVLRLPTGDAAVSFVDARDVAAVCGAALMDGGHAGAEYAITGPDALTLNELATAVELGYQPVDDAAYRKAATRAGWDPGYVATVGTLFDAIRAGWHAEVTGDVQHVLGRPAIPFTRFAEEHSGDLALR